MVRRPHRSTAGRNEQDGAFDVTLVHDQGSPRTRKRILRQRGRAGHRAHQALTDDVGAAEGRFATRRFSRRGRRRTRAGRRFAPKAQGRPGEARCSPTKRWSQAKPERRKPILRAQGGSVRRDRQNASRRQAGPERVRRSRQNVMQAAGHVREGREGARPSSERRRRRSKCRRRKFERSREKEAEVATVRFG